LTFTPSKTVNLNGGLFQSDFVVITLILKLAPTFYDTRLGILD
jgi:hypothetical protein